MRKVIAAINMTVDGVSDHTAVDPDADIHQHYTELLRNAGVLLYGRTTYHLMEYWRTVLDHPTGNAAMDEFAVVMNETPKVVFSHTLKSPDWHSARLATQDLASEVRQIRSTPGKDIYVGSPGLITQLTQMKMIDEYQFCIHPVIAGHGQRLFRDITEKVSLRLQQTKLFRCGAIILYYERLPE